MIVLAGLMGASGIILAAAAAHAAPGAGLDSAAYMLLIHATAVLGGAALLQQGPLQRPLMLVVLAAWVLGSALFSGDIALRAFAGYRLFALAAPTGGIILIVAWLGLAATAVIGQGPNERNEPRMACGTPGRGHNVISARSRDVILK
jgi:uncharacterized membrane protein YgdD (TMEM256/DUF423 family)